MTSTRKTLATLLLPLLMLTVTAPVHAASPGGTYLQIGYADWDNFDNGLNIGGSFVLMPSLRLFGSYTDTDLEHLRLGGSWLLPLEPGYALEFGASYNRFDFGPVDDTGLGIHAILQLSPTAGLTLSGKLEYILMDDLDNETVLGLDADFRFTANISGFLNYSIYNEIDNNLIVLGARLHF